MLVATALCWARGSLPASAYADVPEGRQNMAEGIMDFFYGQARRIDRTETTPAVAAFLATCFLLILLSNAVGIMPIPLVNYPPTAYFSITLGLALCAVVGTLALSGAFNGIKATLKHLVWPNPLQIISEFTDVLSLSLRLFGNIAGEYLTLVLVTSAVAVGIPLILHVLGLIPTFVQALVFTLLTASFIAGALERHAAGRGERRGGMARGCRRVARRGTRRRSPARHRYAGTDAGGSGGRIRPWPRAT